jgi:YebC/PmpR family DNA-binding regulatory protein
VKAGGPDVSGNPRLRLAIDKAKGANVPKDSVKRAVEKGSGAAGGEAYEEIVYEGYGPSGAALLVDCMTDNRNRAVSDVRHAFEKYGGHLGTSGTVAWMFHKRGLIHVLKADAAEDRLLEVALEAGASDVRDDGEVWTVDCEPAAFLAVQDALVTAAITAVDANLVQVPETRVVLAGDKAESMMKLIAALEDLDDVQEVHGNHEVPDEILEKY